MLPYLSNILISSYHKGNNRKILFIVKKDKSDSNICFNIFLIFNIRKIKSSFKDLNNTLFKVLNMSEKITSIKINPELWKKVKLLVIERGSSLKSLLEELLINEIEAEELVKEEFKTSESLLKVLEERRKEGQIPFIISIQKSATELVREERENV